MKIAIDKKKVIDSVISLTARAGKGADIYDGIAATEDNTPVLEQYLSTAVTEAEGELRKRLKGSSLSDVSSNTEIVMEIKDYVRADRRYST